MKKLILLFAICLLTATSCNNSPESKAEALIKEEMPKNLIKPKSYDPIEIKVDSAFAPLDNPELFKQLEKSFEISKQIDDCKNEIEMTQMDISSAKSSMALYSGSYSAFERNEYQEAKDEYDKNSSQLEYSMNSMKGLAEQLKKQMETFNKLLNEDKKFIGYRITHSYRAENNAGQININNDCFIVDKDFEEILYSMTSDDYKSFVNSIDMIKQQLNISLDELNKALGTK